MPSINNLEAMPKRVLNIFYVLDTSGSMKGDAIDTLNSAMSETIDELSKQVATNADAQLKISVLEFNSGCDWLQPNGPEDVEDFSWRDLEAKGITDIGHALEELNDKLSKNEYLSSLTGSFLPIIIFMTDGGATDNYKKYLDYIRKNKWFARATKIGFALGDAPDKKMIAEIVGNCEAVVSTSNLLIFSKLIKFVSIRSSMLCSATNVATHDVKGSDVIRLAVENENSGDFSVGVESYVVDEQSFGDYDDYDDDDWN